jgi:hypothetical protein
MLLFSAKKKKKMSMALSRGPWVRRYHGTVRRQFCQFCWAGGDGATHGATVPHALIGLMERLIK